MEESSAKRKAKQAAREAEQFSKRPPVNPRRSKALQPDWNKFKSLSFTQFLQHALLEDEDNDDDDDDDDGDLQGSCANASKEASIQWNNGMVKVTLPKGWWDEGGISQDRTARGPAWQAGTVLGDFVVQNPIKQQVSGIGGIYEYVLMDSPAISVAQFREKADEYRQRQVGSALQDNYDDDNVCDDLARRFWKRLGPTTPPSMYGADMEGSLFDGDKASGWSLENLDTCLHLLGNDLPGVTTPYLYFGMWGAVFCAHTEDMNLLSINYLHAGAPKYWYAIAPQHAKRFESLAESHFGHKARECPEFLRHKQALLSPAVLQKAGVPFEIQVQRPGDAIITCPGAYHFGVNLGFNVAEATNIAIPEWIPMGRRAKVCMCRPSSVRIDVDLFARLLQQYEHDADKARRMGFPKLSYRKWATARESEEDAPTFGAIASSSTTKIPSAISKKHPFWVEVTIPLSDRGNGRKVGQHANKRRKKQHKEEEEWRLAKPLVDIKMRRQVQKLDSKVLCLLPGRREDSDREDEQCFAGVVKEISEGFVRVHFCGLRKEDDVWMSVTSDKLFMDGGKWLPTSAEKKLWEQDQQKQIIHSGKSCRSG